MQNKKNRIGLFLWFMSGWLTGLADDAACQTKLPPSRTVKFNVAYSRTLPVGEAQKWFKTLTNAGADGVRLVLNPDQKVRLVEEKFKSKSMVDVYAKIDSRQNLVVEGESFSITDSGELKRWIQKIKSAKSLDPNEQPGAFGLTPKQLVAVYEKLGKPFPTSTRNKSVAEIVQTARAQIGTKIGADAFALEALRDDVTVPEELQGLACGTVLAAVIRPLGLVLTMSDGGKQFALIESRKADEHWPIGWPLQQRPSKVAPVLFQQTEVDIEGFPLDKVLKAIEAKTEIPFIYDQNSLARLGIELNKVTVNIGKSKTYYEKIIRQCLSQSKPRLTVELRVDETEQPFLWVTGTKSK